MTTITPEERSVRRRADLIATLPRVEGFQILTEEMEYKRLRMEKTLMARVMADDMSGEALQRQADYDRGFVAGMRYAVLDVPQSAARKVASGDLHEDEPGEVEDRWM